MDEHVSNHKKFIGDGKCKPTNWKRGKLLGRGAHAKVYFATRLGELTGKYAVKQVLISEDSDSKYLETIKKELKVFQKVRHHRIVDYYDFTITQQYFSLFIGCYEKGSLAKYIKEQPGAYLTEQKAAIFTLQLLEGLEYLHNKKIVHRDIKGSNILMQDDYNIKISDFGIAKIVSTLSKSSSQQLGTVNWMAPEMWQDVPHDSKVDIWSLGCTVYQMITGEMPLKDLFQEQIMYKANENELEVRAPEHCSSVLKGFLSLACEKKPTDRPSANELMQHSFVKDLKATDTYRRDELQQASRGREDNFVNKLLETGYDVNIVNENGMNYLMLAETFGHKHVLINLIGAGSNVNKLDNRMHIYSFGSYSIVNILLDHGADIKQVNDAGKDALMLGFTRLYSTIIELKAMGLNRLYYTITELSALSLTTLYFTMTELKTLSLTRLYSTIRQCFQVL